MTVEPKPRRALPPPLPPLEPDPSLIHALSVACECSAETVRRWLTGETMPPPHLRARLVSELWAPLRGGSDVV